MYKTGIFKNIGEDKMEKNLSVLMRVILLGIALLLITGSASMASDQMITFNFVDVEIPAVIKFISDITGYNFIFDERIKGKVTIIAPTKLTVEESFTLFTSVLGLKGYTIIPSGKKTYKIIPSSLAKQVGGVPAEDKIPVNEGYITKLIPLEHIRAEEAVRFLRPVVSRDGHISDFGPRNLILLVDSATNIEKIMSILRRIDQPPTHEEPSKINVYFLENADATELAEVLKGVIKGAEVTKRIAPRRKKTKTTDSLARISITPDKATNSLIIVAPPSEYRNLVQVIKALDKRRKQVFVEAMIIEASIDKLREIGAKWRALARHEGEPIAIGGFGNISTNTLLSIINGLTGFSGGGMGNFLSVPVTTINSDGTATTTTLTVPGFAALFSLSEFRDAVNVLSTPQILTSDNKEAEIVVGENVPFISQRERDITTTNTVLSSIERKDVGITLRITPQITEGDYVKLDIYQEISAVKETPESIVTTVGPTTTKRSTKTSIVVRDGQTVVIGGLMQEREEETIAKTPVLGDVPVLSWLFKHKTKSRTKTNLLVFLTPHIIKESSQLSELTEKKHRSFSMEEKSYAEGELLVKFRDGITEDMALEIISQKRALVIRYMKDINLYHIKLREGQTVEEAIKEFTDIPEVLYAEPNYKIKLNKPPQQPETPSVPEEPPAQGHRLFGPFHPFLSGLDRR